MSRLSRRSILKGIAAAGVAAGAGLPTYDLARAWRTPVQGEIRFTYGSQIVAHANGTAVAAGDLTAGEVYGVIFNGSNWLLLPEQQ